MPVNGGKVGICVDKTTVFDGGTFQGEEYFATPCNKLCTEFRAESARGNGFCFHGTSIVLLTAIPFWRAVQGSWKSSNPVSIQRGNIADHRNRPMHQSVLSVSVSKLTNGN